MIVDLLEEYLKNYTMIQEVWRHQWRFLEKKELWERRTVAINTFTLLFSKSKERKHLDDKTSVMSMTNHAVVIGNCTRSMTIRSYLPSDASANFPDQTNFQAGS